MKKRGQFYLISAIVMISLIIGFATMSNYLRQKSFVKIYYLGEELEIESENILDYYTHNSGENLEDGLKDFIKTYSDYSGVENLYFIFGNQESVLVVGYQDLAGDIFVDGSSLSIPAKSAKSQRYPSPMEDVEIIINEDKYNFDLNTEKNFYFIMSQKIGEEKYVVTN